MEFPWISTFVSQATVLFISSEQHPIQILWSRLVWCLPNDTELYMANRWTLEMSWPSVFGGNFHIHSRVSTVRSHTSNGTTNNAAKSHLLTKNGRKPTGAPGLPHVDTKEILQHFRLAIQASQAECTQICPGPCFAQSLQCSPKKKISKSRHLLIINSHKLFHSQMLTSANLGVTTSKGMPETEMRCKRWSFCPRFFSAARLKGWGSLDAEDCSRQVRFDSSPSSMEPALKKMLKQNALVVFPASHTVYTRISSHPLQPCFKNPPLGLDSQSDFKMLVFQVLVPVCLHHVTPASEFPPFLGGFATQLLCCTLRPGWKEYLNVFHS